MKILFTHSYFQAFDPKQVAHAQPYPPLATLYAASLMRSLGHEVQVFDTMFCKSADEIIPRLKEFKPEVVVVYDDGFNYLTKMCLTNMRQAAFRMQALARDRGCRVLTSGSDATDHQEDYLENGAELLIIGEGEHTLKEVVECIAAGKGISDIQGIAYLENNKVVNTPARPVMRQLDELPPPAFDLVDLEPYKKVWLQKQGYFSINLVTTRGCPYKCNWCAKPIYGNRYNHHSPEYIVNLISALQPTIGFSHIWFADDIFGLKPSWVEAFSKLVHQKDLKLSYKIQSRADLLVEPDYVQALASSGCSEVWLGAESGSQKILDAMDKGTTVEQIVEARRLLKQHGIKACFFLQFGYPGENIEDIRLTLELLRSSLPDDIGISVSYPLPGTKFYENVRSQLGEKTNWTDSDEMALMFRNTYSPEFYKQLHHYVHRLFRQERAKGITRIRSLKDLKKKAAYPYYLYTTKKSLSRLNQIVPDAAQRV